MEVSTKLDRNDELSIRIYPGSSVRGQLVGPDLTTPYAGHVRLSPVGENGRKVIQTDEEGFFEFLDLVPGEYLIRGNAGGWHTDEFEFKVSQGDKVQVFQLSLLSGALVNGAVTVSNDPNTISGGRVSLRVGQSTSLATVTDINGNFEFKGVPPGDATVAIMLDDGREQRKKLVILDHSTTLVEFEFGGQLTLSGTVVSHKQRDEPAYITATPAMSTVTHRSTYSTLKGEYSISGLDSGVYRVRAAKGAEQTVHLTESTVLDLVIHNCVVDGAVSDDAC